MAKKIVQMLKCLIVFFLVVISISLTACSTPGTYMGANDTRKPYRGDGITTFPKLVPITPNLLTGPLHDHHEYRIGPQDILSIIVWNHPELTIPSMQTTSENVNIYTNFNQGNAPPGILVNEHGSIFFPLAGKIQVSQLTVDEIRKHLTKRLSKYIRNPQVSVRVSAFRNKPVYVIGEVMKSGIQYITDMPLTIMDAINQAGGIDRENSDTQFIYVIRDALRCPTVFWLDASSPTGILMGTRFRLESRDVLLVSTAGVARYARLVNRILPTIQTLTNQPIQTRN